MDETPGAQVADALGLLLRRSAREQLYADLARGLHEAIGPATYPVISGLARLGPCSAAQLAAVVGIDRTVVSRHASRLQEAGLLRRVPDPGDGRATLLVLTDAGIGHVAVMRRRLSDALDAYLATWPGGQAEAFAVSLLRFAAEGPFA
jgi:DNA-binding MarR family transcriptional regulator